MKRISKYISLFAAVSLLSVACTESFLEREPTAELNTSGALSRFQDVQVAINGIYRAMEWSWYYGRNFVVTGDVAADNVKVSPTNSGRFLEEYNYSLNDGDDDPEGVWQYGYDAINRANMVINNIDDIEDATEEEINDLLGEALALRALCHFDMVRYFAQPYNLSDPSIADGADGAGGHLGVPYVKISEVGTPARETVASNYVNIISDLRRAITLMTIDPDVPAYMSATAAEALLSRVYLYSENWDSAYYYADRVINSGVYTLIPTANYVASWGQEYSSESIFELKFRLDDFFQTNALGYIYLESGYGDLVPTQDILDLYEETDVRSTGKNGDISEPVNTMYYNIDGQIYISKYPGRENTGGLDNVKVIRLSEIYLNRAEAAYHTGDADQARADVTTIRQRANPSASAVIASGSALLDEILLERRLELAYEGHRYFDLIRNKRDIVRVDHTLIDGTTPYPNQRFCFPIPDDEMNANPNMVQNPAYE